MQKYFLRITALCLTLCLLAGCSVQIYRRDNSGEASQIPDFGTQLPETPSYSAPQSSYSQMQQLYGSAGLVGFPTALVSVYLSEADGAQWDDESIAESRRKLALAVNWIKEQCAQYNAAPKLYCDDGSEDSGLFYHMNVNYTFATDGEEEGDEYCEQVESLCKQLDTDELHQKYGTSSVGFLFFIPVEGCSFTMVHYWEDGGQYYHEYCNLYAYDVYSELNTPESPATYAHEILHLFGAPDLYEGSSDYYVTDELVDYVEENWPDSIMLDTYEWDGGIDYNAINKIIDPLTAYRLGLCNTFEGIEQFPMATTDPQGSFGYDEAAEREELPMEAA